MQILKELKDRRLFRIIVSAVAGGWVLLEAVGSFTEQGILPEVAYRIGLVWYLAAIAIAAILGWHHGEKGRQGVTVGEMAGLGLTLFVAIGMTAWTMAVHGSAAAGVPLATAPADAPIELHPNRVGVAPLRNETSDPELDALGRLGADWITEGLHRTGVVDVVPSPMAIQAARYVEGLIVSAAESGRMVDPLRALGEETGARTVVSGSYYLFGDSVQFQLQITNVESGTLLDQLEPIAAHKDTPTPSLGLIRGRVMGSLALNLDERLAGHAEQTENPPDYRAYQAFSRGIDAYTRSQWEESVVYFAESRQLDTAFALPLLYESFGRSNLGQNQEADSIVDLLGTYASQLSPYHRAWVRHLQAQFDLDRPAALQAIREAASMAPGSKASYNASWLAVINNRPAEAIEWLDRLEPERGPMRGWFHYWGNRAEALHMLGRHEEGLEVGTRARQIYPERSEGLRLEVLALVGLGRIDEVMAIARDAPNHQGTDRSPGWVLGSIAVELNGHGYLDEERQTLRLSLAWHDEALALNPVGEARRALLEDRQLVLHGLERYEEALQALDELTAEFGPRPAYQSRRVVVQAWLGDVEEARRGAAALDTLEVPFTRPTFTLQQARVAAVLGEADRAVSLFARSIQEGLAVPLHPGRDFQRVADYPALVELLRPRG